MTADDRAFRLLNRQLQRLLKSRDLHARFKRLWPNTASSEWELHGKRLDVDVDPDTTGKIPALGHELLHLLYEARYDGLPYELEEPQVQALEEGWLKFLQKDKRRMMWWRHRVRNIKK